MMAQPNYLMVMGTFRTGSTLMAKALSAHRRLTVASDPYFQFFKSLRNELFLRARVRPFDQNSPLSDNFCSPHVSLNAILHTRTLRIPIVHVPLERTLRQIARYAKRDAPKIVPLLPQVRAKTYDELFRELMRVIQRAYGRAEDAYCGFKCTFAEQFLSVVLNTYPRVRCIYLIRDPRAVAASQGAFYDYPPNRQQFPGRGHYPLLYVIRHWRKSVAYLVENLHRRNQVLLVRYEDVTAHPRVSFQRICRFLDVPYDPAMAEPRNYQDGEGRRWTQNSSYGTSPRITTKFLQRWKRVLSAQQLQFIEDLCAPEMEALGYPRLTADRLLDSCLLPPEERLDTIDPWIGRYVKSFVLDERQAQEELVRRAVLTGKRWNGLRDGTPFLQRLYLVEDFPRRLAQLRSAAG